MAIYYSGLLDQSQSQKLNLQHKCDSLSKDVKRLLKQIEDVQTSTSKQLKEASIALERRNEEFRVSNKSFSALLFIPHLIFSTD